MEPEGFSRNIARPRAARWTGSLLILPALWVLSVPGISCGEERTLLAEGRQPLAGLNSQEARAIAVGRARAELGTRAAPALADLAAVKALRPDPETLAAIALGVLPVTVKDAAQGGAPAGGGGSAAVTVQAKYDPAALDPVVRKVLVDAGLLRLLRDASTDLQGRLSAPPSRESARVLAAQHEYLNGLAQWLSGGVGALTPAADAFTKATALAPDFAPAWSARGTVRMAMSEPDAGLQDLARAVSLDPKSAALLRARAAGQAAWLHYAEAEADVNAALRLDPSDAAAYNLRGELMASYRRLEAALQDFDDALRAMPDYAAAHYNRGAVLEKLGRSEAALRAYDQALRLDPGMIPALNNRGNLYARHKPYDKALKDFDEAIRRDPRYAPAFNNRGEVYRAMGQIERAIQDFDEAIRLRPSYANAYVNRAAALEQEGKVDLAFKDLAYAAPLMPLSPYLYARRGTVYARLSLSAQACVDWRKACELGDQATCDFLRKPDVCAAHPQED